MTPTLRLGLIRERCEGGVGYAGCATADAATSLRLLSALESFSHALLPLSRRLLWQPFSRLERFLPAASSTVDGAGDVCVYGDAHLTNVTGSYYDAEYSCVTSVCCLPCPVVSSRLASHPVAQRGTYIPGGKEEICHWSKRRSRSLIWCKRRLEPHWSWSRRLVERQDGVLQGKYVMV